MTGHLDQAVDCINKGDFVQAEKLLLQLLDVDKRNFDAIHMLGVVCSELKKFDEAETYFKKAMAVDAKYPPLFQNYGLFLCRLQDFQEAIFQFSQAIRLAPKFPPFYFDRANALAKERLFNESLTDYNAAIALYPKYSDAFCGRGSVLYDLKRYDEALAAYDQALAFKPDLAEAWLGRGNIFYDLKRYDEAFAAYDKGLTFMPDVGLANGYRLRTKVQLCNWDNISVDCARLIEAIRNNKDTTDPFTFLGMSSSAEDQYTLTRHWVQKTCPPSREPLWKGELYKHDKIRIGYMSADFREHPIAHLMAGVFEHHDKSKFDMMAISIGPNDNSPTRRRIQDSFENFIDASSLSNGDVAAQIRIAEIDILVDLTGFTQYARTNIFARRPAPIQVNYLGYPGTMGAEYFDYIIADPVVIPFVTTEQLCGKNRLSPERLSCKRYDESRF